MVDGVVIEIWIVLALAQVALIALVAAAVCGWRWRAAAARNAVLSAENEAARDAVEAGTRVLAKVQPSQTWEEMLDERIAAIAQSDSAEDRLRLMVLRHERDGSPLELPKVDESDEIERLNAQIRNLEDRLQDEAQLPSDREGELKALVQQFTHDSREMLSCIQNLESECNDLRAQLAEATRAA